MTNNLTQTTDPAEVRTAIEEMGEHRGGWGIVCGRDGDWSEQAYERGTVRTFWSKPTRSNGFKSEPIRWLIWRGER